MEPVAEHGSKGGKEDGKDSWAAGKGDSLSGKAKGDGAPPGEVPVFLGPWGQGKGGKNDGKDRKGKHFPRDSCGESDNDEDGKGNWKTGKSKAAKAKAAKPSRPFVDKEANDLPYHGKEKGKGPDIHDENKGTGIGKGDSPYQGITGRDKSKGKGKGMGPDSSKVKGNGPDNSKGKGNGPDNVDLGNE